MSAAAEARPGLRERFVGKNDPRLQHAKSVDTVLGDEQPVAADLPDL